MRNKILYAHFLRLKCVRMGKSTRFAFVWLSRRFCIDFVSYYLLKEKRILGSLAIDVYMRMNTVDKKDNYCNKQ